MGRVKTTIIKNKAKEIFLEYKDFFSLDFKKNKEVVAKVTFIPSKKIRNKVTGHITRLKKRVKDWEVL